MRVIEAGISDQVNTGITTLLSDGEWHVFGQFISIADCVPPEYAARSYLTSRSDGLGADKPLDEQISRGRKRVLTKRLAHLARYNKVEVEGTGFKRRYRLTEFDSRIEAVKAVDELIARASTAHLGGQELKDYLCYVASTLLFKVNQVE